jgi:hypothetical protein
MYYLFSGTIVVHKVLRAVLDEDHTVVLGGQS